MAGKASAFTGETNDKGYAVVARTDYAPTGAAPGHDGKPPEFMPARDIHSRDRMTGKIVREVPDGPENVNHSRVRNMHVRKRLTDRQAAAADRYQKDWQLSQQQVLSVAGMVRVEGCARSTLPDARLDAMSRWAIAQAALGARYVRIVALVVLDDVLVEVAANILRLDKRKAAERLECGLERLADFYGFAEETI